jgi:hypothetical protein
LDQVQSFAIVSQVNADVRRSNLCVIVLYFAGTSLRRAASPSRLIRGRLRPFGRARLPIQIQEFLLHLLFLCLELLAFALENRLFPSDFLQALALAILLPPSEFLLTLPQCLFQRLAILIQLSLLLLESVDPAQHLLLLCLDLDCPRPFLRDISVHLLSEARVLELKVPLLQNRLTQFHLRPLHHSFRISFVVDRLHNDGILKHRVKNRAVRLLIRLKALI